jgi:hypothetical protein
MARSKPFPLSLLLSCILSTSPALSQWEQTSGPEGGLVKALVTSTSGVFAATYGGGMFRSSDGTKWIACSNPAKRRDSEAARGNGAYRSADTGRSWNLVIGLSGQNVRALLVNDSCIFAATAQGGLYRSTDGGISWGAPDAAPPVSSWYCLLSVPPRVYAGTAGGAFVSDDNGRTWASLNNGLPRNMISSLATDGSWIFAGLESSGVFGIPRSGTEWQDLEAGLPALPVRALVLRGDTLFAGLSANGVWRRSVAAYLHGDAVQEHPGMPQEFALSQNYPNPFNPLTIIKYTVGGASPVSAAGGDRDSPSVQGMDRRGQGPGTRNVKLKVYDLLGREVAILVNEEKAPGSYEVRFSGEGGSASGGDGRRLSSGVYIYRLSCGSFVQSKTMLLLK